MILPYIGSHVVSFHRKATIATNESNKDRAGDQYSRTVKERKTKPMQTFQTKENKSVIFPRKSSP